MIHYRGMLLKNHIFIWFPHYELIYKFEKIKKNKKVIKGSRTMIILANYIWKYPYTDKPISAHLFSHLTGIWYSKCYADPNERLEFFLLGYFLFLFIYIIFSFILYHHLLYIYFSSLTNFHIIFNSLLFFYNIIIT